MANAAQRENQLPQTIIRFHHGTDQACANDILRLGVNQQLAALWNSSGEFWVTKDHGRAKWFALSHPGSPPAACFEFDLPELVLIKILRMNPPLARQHGADDIEFLPRCYALLNQYMSGQQIVPVA